MSNYEKKMAALAAAGILKMEKGKVTDIGVGHNDSCGALRGRACDCDPDIYINGKKIDVPLS
jgi:hypothetical protein